MAALRRNYYTVDVPSDLSEDAEERGDIAIREAREAARLYVMPAAWHVVWDTGERVRVCRVSRRPAAR